MLHSRLKAFGIIKEQPFYYRSSLVQELYLEQLCIELISHAEALTPILRDLILEDVPKFNNDSLVCVTVIMTTIDENYNVLNLEGEGELLNLTKEFIKELFKGVKIIYEFIKENEIQKNDLINTFNTLSNKINKALVYFDFNNEV